MQQNKKYYDIKDGSFGHCYIYNCKRFYDKNGQTIQTPVENLSDTKKMHDLLVNVGYNVKSARENPTKEEIIGDLKKIADQNGRDTDSFVFYILTHGGKNNEILTSDGKCITLTELVELVNVSALKGKPKIFVVQACRGEKSEKGEAIDDNTEANQFGDIFSPITTQPDFLFIFPTAPNYVSWLYADNGSWFIDMLTTVIWKYRKHNTMTEMLQRLIFSVNCVPILDKEKHTWYMQVPCFTSTLTKALLLSKYDSEIISCDKLDLKYREEDCIRSRIQGLLQVAADNQVSVFTDGLDHIKFSDYCYLLDESTGCYDVREHRKCFVINAGLENEEFDKAGTDSSSIETAMKGMGFDTKVISENKDRSKSTLTNDLNNAISKLNKDVSCLFCYVLTGSQSFTGDRKLLNEVVGMLKNVKYLLNKPKVFILQTYKTAILEQPGKLDIDVLTKPMRYSTEADVLIIYANSNAKCEYFCQMFYETFEAYGKDVPIIDILVSILPSKYEQKWTNLETAFTSSLKHHLVLKKSFDEYTITEDIQRKKHIKKLENIAYKLMKDIAEKVNIPKQVTATTYEDVLNDGDSKMEKIRESRTKIASNYRVVVAIDFGTRFSGVAWCLRTHLESYEKKEDKTEMPLICIYPSWKSHKTSSCLLLDSDRNFVSFGYEAEQDYEDLVHDDKHKTHYFFQHFKTVLNEKTGVNMNIKDRNGRELPIEEVFSKYLNALVGIFEEIRKRDINLGNIEAKDVKWVLTVPAILSEQCKQLMRKSAEQAGIASYNLSIALEPECASIYCQHLIRGLDREKNAQLSKPVEKIMVVDLGGETVNVAVHKIVEGNKLKEIHQSTHKSCGGASIDNAFLAFLKEIFKTSDDEESCMAMLKRDHPEEYLDLIRNFESKKRCSIRSTQKYVRITFPIKTVEIWCDDKLGKTIETVLADSVHSVKVNITANKLTLETSLYNSFFRPSTEKIIALLNGIFKEELIQDVTHVVLVGGFADSSIIQAKIKSAFAKKRVFAPLDCDLAVLKGAVMYGHTPSSIAERIIPYTYGIVCQQKMNVLIKKNTAITIQKINEIETGQGCLEHKIYMSTELDPQPVIGKPWVPVGELLIHVSKPSECKNSFTIHFLCGGTELKAYATDKTGKCYRITIEMKC